LHGIAVRVALNVRRARKRRVGAMERFAETQSVASDAPSPEGALVSLQQLAKLEKYLAEEPEDRRAAFIMYYVEELDLSEIAAVLGTKPEATLARIRRTRIRVLDAIAQEQRALQRRDTDVA
jgi:RNA polymerase sigma factor (sigma-70 family)